MESSKPLGKHKIILPSEYPANLALNSALIDQAITIFGRWSWYENELARVLFLRAKLNQQMGDEQAYEKDRDRARRLLEKITGTTFAPDEALTLQDFEAVVASSVA
jgi:hypothetical protein